MRMWSLVLLAITALAAIAGFGGFREDNDGIMVARVLFGIVLLLFAISLLSDQGEQKHDERHDG